MPPEVVDGPAVIVGVDGAGRTYRLDQIAAGSVRSVLRVDPSIADVRWLAAELAGARGRLVLVDDAHRLTEEQIAALVAAARNGAQLVVARRPTLRSRAHAELDEAVGGRVDQLRPLDVTAVAAVIGEWTGAAVGPERASAVWAESGGLPAIVVAIAGTDPDATLTARVQRRLALLDPPVADLARLLALGLDLPDTVLAAASHLEPAVLGPAMREIADHGMIVPGTETMIPAVSRALLADLPAVQRRRVHEAVARALVEVGADPLPAAEQLRAARAYVPASATVFAAAGERLRLRDPAAALAWYDDAVEAGGEPDAVALGRAEASVLLGLPVQAPVVRDRSVRVAALAGAIEAHHGRNDRAAQALLGAGPTGALLAVPSLVSMGDLDGARDAVARADGAPVGLHRLAEAAIAAGHGPAGAVPLFIEAAEAVGRMPPTLVPPDTAHALGALIAGMAGDTASAEHLLEVALSEGLGGPVFAERHRLLLAWVRMRAGRYDTAIVELSRPPPAMPGRDALLRAALRAGIARRSGDIATLREAWAGIEPALARRTVDLFAIEPLEELVVAAARLRQVSRAASVLDALEAIVERLGAPADWVVAVGWTQLQAAVATEDAAAAAAAAVRIAEACRTAGGARQRAQCEAARLWARILAGDVDPDAATVVATDLAAVDLPWEGSRLVGAAAIRSGDATAARRLLERARDLSSAEVVSEKGRAPSVHGGLSEREVEVARKVLSGDTYREIGARLFISPKTVEHHVARIRTKVGATSRAEFVAALRSLLESATDPLSGAPG